MAKEYSFSYKMRELLNMLLFNLRFVGVDPRYQNCFSRCVQIVCRSCGAMVMLSFFMEIVLNWRGLKSLAKLNMFPSMCMVQIKMLIFQTRNEKICKIIEMIENLYVNHEHPEDVEVRVKDALKLASNFVKSFYAIGMFTTAAFLLTPFLSSDKALHFTPYDFCDLHTSPCFEINYAWNVLNQYFLYFNIINYDCLFIYFVAEAYCAIEVTKGMLKRLGGGCRNAEVEEFVLQHNAALNYIKELNRFYSNVLLLQSWFSLGALILSLYILTSEGIPPPSSLVAKYGVLIITLTVQLFIYCFGGAIIMEQTKTVGNAVFYEVDWWSKTQPGLRKNLSFIIFRTQKVGRLSVGKIVDLNLEFFVAILKNTLSVYTLLLTVEKKAQLLHQ